MITKEQKWVAACALVDGIYDCDVGQLSWYFDKKSNEKNWG